MRRIAGALLICGGVALLYLFAVWGTVHGEDIAPGNDQVPFLTLGRNYPKDALAFLGAAWGILLGLAMVLKGETAPAPPAAAPGDRSAAAARLAAMSQPEGGTIALFHLLNACLLLSMLFVAYIGSKSGADTKLVGVFFGTALLQAGFGLILMVLAAFEKPKGVGKLLLGSAVYLFGVAIGVLAFAWGA